MNDNLKFGLKVLLGVVILFITMMLFFGAMTYSQETIEPNVEISPGLEISYEEFECYQICEGRHYLYKPRSGYKQMLCVCGEYLK